MKTYHKEVFPYTVRCGDCASLFVPPKSGGSTGEKKFDIFVVFLQLLDGQWS